MPNVKATFQNLVDLAPLLVIDQLKTQIGPTLVLATRVGDELLGCGGLIKHLRNQEVPIVLVYVTNQEECHPNYDDSSTARDASLIETQVIEICKLLGVDSSHVIFLNQTAASEDQMTSEVQNHFVTELKELLDQFHIETLCLPWRDEINPKHRATYGLGIKATKQTVRAIQILEYPIGLRKHLNEKNWRNNQDFEIYKLDARDVLEIKKKAISASQIQMPEINLTNYEYFFIPLNPNANTLGKDYFDTLYSNNPDPWNFNGSEYEQSKFEKINQYLQAYHYKNALELGCSIGVQTQFLAPHCDSILAVDINENAINFAKELNAGLPKVQFQQLDVLNDFPSNEYDFITMCELGYYFSKVNLLELFGNIDKHLKENGHFLMVHWTSYVRDFPLSGTFVHQYFIDFDASQNKYAIIAKYVHESYELILWKKLF